MKLYISDVGLMLVAIICAATGLLLWAVLRKALPQRRAARWLLVAGGVFATAAFLLWDVVITSTQMVELCPKAGVNIKRTVRVDGYLTVFNSAEALEHGFKYIEAHSSGGRITLYTKRGEKVHEEYFYETYKPKSRFEVKRESSGEPVRGTTNIDTAKTVVRDRVTGEELGQAVLYRAYPGWLERSTTARVAQLLWVCSGGHATPGADLERGVLLPSSSL